MKIHPVGAELFRADGQSDMTNLIVAFRNFGNVSENKSNFRTQYRVDREKVARLPFCTCPCDILSDVSMYIASEIWMSEQSVNSHVAVYPM